MPTLRPIPRDLVWSLVAWVAFAFCLFTGRLLLGLPFFALGLALRIRFELSEQGREGGLNPHIHLAVGYLASIISVLAVVALLIGGWNLNMVAMALEALLAAGAFLFLYYRLRDANSPEQPSRGDGA